MSQADRVQQQVYAAIVQSELPHRQEADFIRVLAPPVEGENQSTEVRVRSAEHANGNVVVYMMAPVLGELPTDDEAVIAKAHMICNSLNQDQLFGRWVYYPDEGNVVIEHELVGEDLDPSEIMGTLASVAHSADRWDDVIQADLGAGERLYSEDDVVE